MVEDLGLASGSVGDKGLVEDIEDILANLLQLTLDLVAVVADGADVLIGALGLLLLLDRGDDSPAGTAGADNVLVRHREQVALVDGELTTKLGNLLHVGDHLIVTLGLLAEASQESLAVDFILLSVCVTGVGVGFGFRRSSKRSTKHTHLSRYIGSRSVSYLDLERDDRGVSPACQDAGVEEPVHLGQVLLPRTIFRVKT